MDNIIAQLVNPLLSFIRNKLDQTKVKIKVAVPRVPFNVEYYLLHVRDGKDEFPSKDVGELKNSPLKMKRISNDEMAANVITRKKIGFQFKCFAKCHRLDKIDDLINSLREIGHTHVGKGTHNNYVWFILRDYPTCQTSDKGHKYLNNYYDHINRGL